MHDLSFESLAQKSWLVQCAVLLGSGFLVIALGYFLLISSAIDELHYLMNKEILLKKDFELKQQQSASVVLYRQQLSFMHVHFGPLLQELFVNNEMPRLLEDISKAGMRVGLKFEAFNPQPQIKHDVYTELPIKITVVGTYKQLAVFLSHIARMKRLISWHEFSLVQQPSNKALVMNITAIMYQSL